MTGQSRRVAPSGFQRFGLCFVWWCAVFGCLWGARPVRAVEEAGVSDLLAGPSYDSVASWGTAVRIPPDTGEFAAAERTVTVLRKRPAGDFKIYRVFKGLEDGAEYVLNFRIKVDAKTAARVGILDGPDGRHDWSWVAEAVAFEPTGEWQRAAIRFAGRPGRNVGCLQIYPPTDIGGSVSVGVMSIWPVADLASVAGSESVYPCHRLPRAPTVDGQLDEDAWGLLPEVAGFAPLSRAASSDDGLQVMPDGIEMRQAQRAFVTDSLSFFQAAYTDDALYVAIRCYQPGAERLPASETNKADLWREDCAEIHVVPGENQSKHQFIVNSVGAMWPGEGWRVKTRRRRGSWLVEAEIPFARLGKAPEPDSLWSVNISRHATTPRDSLSTWAPDVVNFHDVAHYRRFEFLSGEPSAAAKQAEELSLNRAFHMTGEASADEEAGGRSVPTHVFIHTRNADAALFVNRRRLPLRARVWPTSYAGFREQTLSVVAELQEGRNTVVVVARATGPEPGIRIEAGRTETDARWRCAETTGGDWLNMGFDDSAWTPVRPNQERRESFYWPADGEQLVFRQVIRGVMKCSQSVRYAVCDWERKGLGRHRAIVRVEKGHERIGGRGDAAYLTNRYAARIVWAHIPWRRRDVSPHLKGIRVFSSETGKPVQNVVVLSCRQEYGDIAFEPVSGPGEYEIYYLPYVQLGACPRRWGMTDPYLKRHEEPDPNWLTRAAAILGDQGVNRYEIGDLSRANWQRLPRAELVELQAKTAFDRFDPMEVIATGEEIGDLLAASADRAYLVFPEDRDHPTRMFETIPLRWVKRGPVPEFAGACRPDEAYCYQLGVFASQADIVGMEVDFADLRNADGDVIPASRMTCFNLTGIDWLGHPFTKPFRLDKGRVRPLWIGVRVPRKATGTYAGQVTVRPHQLEPVTIRIGLRVAGTPIESHGDDNPFKHTRLRWLNSTLGLDDDWLVPPYTPLRVTGNRIACLDRAVEFGPMGLPAQVTSRGRHILVAPMALEARRGDGREVNWTAAASPRTVLTKQGKIVREYRADSEEIHLHNTVSMEFDGCVEFELRLRADKPSRLRDVAVCVPYDRALVEYMAGANGPGGYRVPERDWPFSSAARGNSGIWLGHVDAGMQFRAYGGAGSLREEGSAVLVTARAADLELAADKTATLRYRLLITPFRPISDRHWRTRVGDPFREGEGAAASIVHIHHGNAANPWINYPFLYTDKLRDLQQRVEGAGGLGVQLYYTVRELTSRCAEIWALRSLGDEIFSGGNLAYVGGTPLDQGTGHPWLREHLAAGYRKAWRTGSPYDVDAAVSQRFLSRWHNYYVEGLDWLLRNKCFYSLYLDGIGYDREIMKRVARVMSRANPEYRIEHHQCTNPTGSNSVINMYLEHIPYVTELWYGESFNYNKSPDYWLVDISGLPFGVTGEMLDNTGTINMYRGMLYGITGRIGGREHIWQLWDQFGIAEAEMIGYWDADCPVKTNCADVPATVYRRPDRSLIALATWSRKPERVSLTIDWDALGLDPDKARLVAPPVGKWQAARAFAAGDPLPVDVGKGWFLIAEPKE